MKKRIKKNIDLRCASSIDEMIQMCEECKFHACEGCEHTWTIVQEVKRLRDHERGEIQNQEKFAKDHGFTPDCTPYYIAEKALERLSDTIGQVENYKKLWKDALATCKKRNVTEKKRLNLYRVVVNKNPTYDEVEEYICAAKSEENARLMAEDCQGDVNKPKEDFQVQHIGLSDNDLLEEIICEIVNWF